MSRRDHSVKELRQKLAQRSFAPNEIDEAIAHCEHYGWLNDARVAEMLLRHGISKGHGLSRIRQDSQRKGISNSLIELAAETLEFDWYEHARDVALVSLVHSVSLLKQKTRKSRPSGCATSNTAVLTLTRFVTRLTLKTDRLTFLPFPQYTHSNRTIYASLARKLCALAMVVYNDRYFDNDQCRLKH